MSRRAGRARTPAAPQSPHNANPVAKGLRRTRSVRPTTVPPPLSAAGAGKVRLWDVLSVKARIGWQGLTQKEHRETGEYNLVTGTDFVDGKVDFSKCVFVDKERYDQDENIQLRNGDLLITKDGTIGKVAVVENMPRPATLNSGVFVVRDVTSSFLIRYLYHFFLAPEFRKLVDGKLTGCTIAHLNQKVLVNLTIPLPPLSAQQRIADELDRLCALKKNAEDRLAILDQIVKSRFVEMFGEESEWPHERIGGILQIERGGSPRPIDKYITDSPEGVNWIKIGDTVPGEIYIEHAKEKILKSGIVKSRKVLPGDFLLSNSMSFGRPYITKIEGYIHDGWLVLRDENKIFEKLFLHQLLSSQYVYKQFAKLASGSTVKNLNKDLVGRVEVPIPPLSLQREFAEFVASVDKLKAALREMVATLDQLYRAKLQEYFG